MKPTGISLNTIKRISAHYKEPEWMLKLRMNAYKSFVSMDNPKWGPDLSQIDFSKVKYFKSPGIKSNRWDDVPNDVKSMFEELGVHPDEQKYLAGTSTQLESKVIYSNLKKRWNSMGIIFDDTNTALKRFPQTLRKYFGKLVPYTDNKYAALNTAVWSGGNYVYVPKGVKLILPVQTYFRINTNNLGQFERTLIIADEDSEIHYIEGCTAPQYLSSSLHAGVVEIYLKKNAKVKYTTLQNWSLNVFNLVTKRAITEENAHMQWVDCNIGSKVTMKYPAVILKGDNSKGEMLSIAFSKNQQIIDSGAKMIHIGKNTRSIIDAKSIASVDGKSVYRGLVKILSTAQSSRSKVRCDSLLLSKTSSTDSFPQNTISNSSSLIEHEAFISRISQEKIDFLTSRGYDEQEANRMIISGFIQPIIEDIPMEYTIELERLLDLFLMEKK